MPELELTPVKSGVGCGLGGRGIMPWSPKKTAVDPFASEERKKCMYRQRLSFNPEKMGEITKPIKDVNKKKKELLTALKRDPIVAELKMVMYVAACNNAFVKPFPTCIVEESYAGLNTLLMVNSITPPLELVIRALETKDSSRPLQDQVVGLLHWLMVDSRFPRIVTCPDEEWSRIMGRVDSAVNPVRPTMIFKVMVSSLSRSHLQWESCLGHQGDSYVTSASKFAFLPTKIEQNHTLVHLGLFPSLKTQGPCGLGYYLTTDLKCCTENSPLSWVWGKNRIGAQIKMVSLVEILVSHPAVTEYVDMDKAICSSENAQDPVGVQYYTFSPHVLQTRYLLVYVNVPPPTTNSTFKEHSAIIKILKRYYRGLTLLALIMFTSRLTFNPIKLGNILEKIKAKDFSSFLRE